jgi:type II secretory pathway component PulF
MADKKNLGKIKNPALIKAMQSLGKVERLYAIALVRMDGKGRLKIYRKLSSLLKNRFSMMDSLERLYDIASDGGKKAKEPLAIAIAQWARSMQNGDTFAVALKGWAPASELLMLSVGDVAQLDVALDNLIHVTEGIARMKAPVVGALGYPMFLMLLTIVIIWAVGKYMVPPMANAAPGLVWRGQAKTLIDLSDWVQVHQTAMFSFLPIVFAIIGVTLSRWKGKARAFVDNYPPYSIYRIFVGVSWLLALSSLVRAGTPVSKALRALQDNASPYLLYRIEKALVFINNGDNLGEALYKTGMGFPDKEIIGDLQIYSELDNFQDALDQLANNWLEESIQSIGSRAEILNTVAILGVSGVIAWVVLGTFDMQDQLTKTMGG